jgi:hypothetical protein
MLLNAVSKLLLKIQLNYMLVLLFIPLLLLPSNVLKCCVKMT